MSSFLILEGLEGYWRVNIEVVVGSLEGLIFIKLSPLLNLKPERMKMNENICHFLGLKEDNIYKKLNLLQSLLRPTSI